MIQISLCMIVKNEEKFLRRCLDSYKELMDEIIIVDTGSTDSTKAIAAEYTDKVYEFPWIRDFAAARNYAFSKATKDYVFSADADEVLDEDNRIRFEALKESLDSRIEIVQMKYGNQLSFGTVYNYDEEYRPKLFKRLREFIWTNPIHEQVMLSPVVYDSDIVITHKPHASHAKRDFETFLYHIEQGMSLNPHLIGMYARELFISGDAEDFSKARPYFEHLTMDTTCEQEVLHQACVVLTRACRLERDTVGMFKFAMKAMAMEECSEICVELGHFYKETNDFDEAVIWYYNGAFETEPQIKLTCKTKDAIEGLVSCYDKLGFKEQAEEYRKLL